MLSLIHISYVVSLARNKYHCSCLLKSNGLPTTNDYLYLPNVGTVTGRIAAQSALEYYGA